MFRSLYQSVRYSARQHLRVFKDSLRDSEFTAKCLIEVAKKGFPNYLLYFGGGLGDQLLLTTVARELHSRGQRVWIASSHKDLFYANPYIAHIAVNNLEMYMKFVGWVGGKTINPIYAPQISGERRDIPPAPHLLAVMCKQAGITGEVTLRPYLFLSEGEKNKWRLSDRQIVIQSTGRSAKHFMWTKEWFPERFQEIVDALKDTFHFIQVGSREDPVIQGAYDLRGKTTPRETAALLYNSIMFVGLVGFLMHLARSVDCRAVIIYGGRELPSQSGYPCNINITGNAACSPCWRWDNCPGNRMCMDQIKSPVVIDSIISMANRETSFMETRTLNLPT